jgi:hypothetical protein
MRSVTFLFLGVLALAACGNKGGSGGGDTLPDDLRTGSGSGSGSDDDDGDAELERRKGAACEELGPRLTECAVADARATMTPAELAKLDIENTAPVHTREFVKSCKGQALSSRQVRVYEVCLREETSCEPLLACLENAKPTEGATD